MNDTLTAILNEFNPSHDLDNLDAKNLHKHPLPFLLHGPKHLTRGAIYGLLYGAARGFISGDYARELQNGIVTGSLFDFGLFINRAMCRYAVYQTKERYNQYKNRNKTK